MTTFEAIMKVVCVTYGVTKNDIVSPRREVNVVLARHIIMLLAKELLPLGYAAIGRMLGGKDHTSVIHACKKMETKKRIDPFFKGHIQHLKHLIFADSAPHISSLSIAHAPVKPMQVSFILANGSFDELVRASHAVTREWEVITGFKTAHARENHLPRLTGAINNLAITLDNLTSKKDNRHVTH